MGCVVSGTGTTASGRVADLTGLHYHRHVNILVVCSGNICRSPMAAVYLQSRLAAGKAGRTRVDSGGTLGIVGDPAAQAAVAVMRQVCDLDLRPHRSAGLSREQVEDADAILVMEGSHRRFIRMLYPSHVSRVRLLSEFAPRGSGVVRGGDIFDPIGLEPEAFARCFQLMQTCLDRFVDSLED